MSLEVARQPVATRLAIAIGPVIEGARRKPRDPLDNVVRDNVTRIVKELETNEPILSEHAHLGQVKIVGARYDLDTGEVEFLPSGPRSASATR